MKNKRILLIGSGYMAGEYLKVLKALSCEVFVIGRNEEKAKALAGAYGYKGIGGGISGLDSAEPKSFDWVINSVSVDSLYAVTEACLDRGFKRILVEKPGAVYSKDLQVLQRKAIQKKAEIRIGYNRRYFTSVNMLKQRIKDDGGVLGCFFDFTDREKDIRAAEGSDYVKRWGWANSVHVIDLAFHLIGLPEQLQTFRHGGWKFHPSGNAFTGSGRTKSSLFSYYSTWAGGGRWNVEISTPRGRYKLSPLEKLIFCAKNQFAWEEIALPGDDDQSFKPGLYQMVNDVLQGRSKTTPTLKEQIELYKVIKRIFGYEN